MKPSEGKVIAFYRELLEKEILGAWVEIEQVLLSSCYFELAVHTMGSCDGQNS